MSSSDSLVDVINFHDQTKQLTAEGIELRESDVIVNPVIKYQKWDDQYPTFYGERYEGMFFSSQGPKQILSQIIGPYFYKLFPLFDNINMDNVLIAGGCIATIISDLWINERTDPMAIQDVDLFIYGLSLEEANKKLFHIIDVFGKRYQKGIVQKSVGSVSLISKDIKIQIILRLYSTASEVLHGFDLGSSMIGIRGKEFITTKFGLFCTNHRVNVVVPKYSSLTYENRLNKYLRRGYAIVMPNLDVKVLNDGENEIGNFYMYVNIFRRQTSRGGFKTDRLEKYNKGTNHITGLLLNKKYDCKVPDYDHVDNLISREYMMEWYFRCLGYDSQGVKVPADQRDEYFFEGDKWEMSLKYSLKRYRSFKHCQGNSIFISILYENSDPWKILSSAINREDLRGSQDFIDAYKLQAPINWRTENPGSQLSGSFNPLNITDKQWYGVYYNDKIQIIQKREPVKIVAKIEAKEESRSILGMVRKVSKSEIVLSRINNTLIFPVFVVGKSKSIEFVKLSFSNLPANLNDEDYAILYNQAYRRLKEADYFMRSQMPYISKKDSIVSADLRRRFFSVESLGGATSDIKVEYEKVPKYVLFCDISKIDTLIRGLINITNKYQIDINDICEIYVRKNDRGIVYWLKHHYGLPFLIETVDERTDQSFFRFAVDQLKINKCLFLTSNNYNEKLFTGYMWHREMVKSTDRNVFNYKFIYRKYDKKPGDISILLMNVKGVGNAEEGNFSLRYFINVEDINRVIDNLVKQEGITRYSVFAHRHKGDPNKRALKDNIPNMSLIELDYEGNGMGYLRALSMAKSNYDYVIEIEHS